MFFNGPVSFQDGADGMLTPPLWSASPVSFQDSDAGSSDLISGERRDQPTTEAMSDKNDAKIGSGRRRPYDGKFDYVPWAGK